MLVCSLEEGLEVVRKEYPYAYYQRGVSGEDEENYAFLMDTKGVLFKIGSLRKDKNDSTLALRILHIPIQTSLSRKSE